MSFASGQHFQYNVGGSLEREAPSYVVRQADQVFYNAIKNGDFSYVFSPRQMGKSSLRVRTMHRLQAAGFACAVVDVSSISSYDITAAEWYLGVVRRLSRGFGIRINVLQWWVAHESLTPALRLRKFIESVLLEEILTEIVIFIDEIDSILHLNFKESFFELISSFYQGRTKNPNLKRLTFALLGVTTPNDLVKNKSKALFKTGKAIHLEPFKFDELEPLAQGLENGSAESLLLLKSIFYWTGGQPFLTQKLCYMVSQVLSSVESGCEVTFVEQMVRTQIIENWKDKDRPVHLTTICERILRSEQRATQLLKLYKQILEKGEIPATQSLKQQEFLLSGLVFDYNNSLRICCRIYRVIFHEGWVKQAIDDLNTRSSRLPDWIESDLKESKNPFDSRTIQQSLNC